MNEPNEREMELSNEYYDTIDCMDRRQIAEMFAAYRRELALKWTREVPTVPGRYLQRELSDGEVSLTRLVDADWALVVDEYDFAVSELTGLAEWAGPLPEPEET